MAGARSAPAVHSIPEVYMSKQVSRLGFPLLEPLPAPQGTVGHRSFVPLTVTGIARAFHPIPSAFGRCFRQIRTRYSTIIVYPCPRISSRSPLSLSPVCAYRHTYSWSMLFFILFFFLLILFFLFLFLFIFLFVSKRRNATSLRGTMYPIREASQYLPSTKKAAAYATAFPCSILVILRPASFDDRRPGRSSAWPALSAAPGSFPAGFSPPSPGFPAPRKRAGSRCSW